MEGWLYKSGSFYKKCQWATHTKKKPHLWRDMKGTLGCTVKYKKACEMQTIGVLSYSWLFCLFTSIFFFLLLFLSCMHAKLFHCVWLFATLWTVGHQSLCPWDFTCKNTESGLPFPPPGDLPIPEIKPVSMSPALAGRFFTTNATCEAPTFHLNFIFKI